MSLAMVVIKLDTTREKQIEKDEREGSRRYSGVFGIE